MHHLYPLAKGDPLCPLGFHPQVRWPTRCKRCFRDYKEHGGKRKEEELSLKRNDSTSSSPNLNSWSIRSDEHRRSWSSNSNLTEDQTSKIAVRDVGPASWTSTPDLAHLEDSTQANIPTVSFTLPKRKSLEISSNTRSLSDSFSTREKSPAFNKSEHSSTRAKKIQAIKDASQEMSKRIQIKELKATVDESTNHDVQFLIQVKSKPKQEQFKSFHEGTESEDDTVSIAGTETTDTTLVGNPHEHEMQEQIDSLRQELDAMKTKCERLDREKSDLLLRRLASMETVTSKTTATEVLKLQQKCNELQSQIEDSRDEKKFLALRVKELEEDVDSRPTAQAAQKHADELRSKLLAAETLCEELMDENEDMKKELRDLEEEIEELQDNFREDQANEYTSLKKELEQTTKNCRILSFKLRKTERKTEQLEVEKGETEKKLREVSNGNNGMEKIKHLEQGLKVATETSLRLQKELDETTAKLRAIEETSSSKKASAIGNIPKLSSDAKVSRESLTRGGSQDDPAQILRDLHDSLEREADLREQLKFAEEEAQNLRKKTSRIEDDNESLVLQLKKMATKAKNRKGSPNRLTPEPIIEKDEGISEDDPTELKLLLELNDQEVSVLRKKVEELEAEKDTHKKKIKDLQDKLTTKTSKKSLLTSVKGQESQDKKLKVLEDETVNLKKQLAEKDKETERLSAELNLTQKRTKGMQKSKSLDIADPQSLDVKRQLQSIEQEAVVLRTKIQTLESENEKLAADNKRLQLLRNTKTSKSEKAGEKYIDRIAELEVELEYANKKVKELENSNGKHKSNDKEGENNRQKPLVLAKQFKDRIPKKPSEFTSKIQLKNMVKDLESEIGDILTALANAEGSKGKLEAELQELKSRSNNIDLTKNLEETKKSLIVAEKELQNVTSKYSQDRSKYDDLNNTLVKTKENLSSQLEEKKQIQNELSSFKDKHKTLEDQLRKQEKEVMRLTTELKNANAKQHEIIAQKGQIDDLSNDLAKKDKEYAKLKQDFDEKEKSLKDLTVAMKKLGDAEQLLRNNEDTMKKNDKQNKDQIKQLSAKLEEERERLRLKESQHLDLSTKWSADHKVFELQIEDLNSKIKSLEKIIVTKNTLIEQLEESVRKERENVTSTNLLVNNNEINSLKDELNKTKANLREVECKLETSSKGKKTADEKLRKAENEHKKEKSELDRKAAELSIELENEKKRYDTVKVNREREMKDKETELNALKGKIKTLESSSTSGNKQVSEIKKEYQERIDKLESKAAKDQQQYEDLTSKYEVLEEEYIVTKAKLVMEKETVSNQLKATKRDLDSLEFELQEVKETYSQKNEQLQKEKQQIAEKMKTLEKNCQKGLDTFGFERGRFKTLLEEKASDLDQIKKEYEVISDQLEYMRKENDDLKKKLDDYDKVSKIQRVISADTSAMEKEIKQLRGRLTSTEELRKSDLAECKLRYDSQVIAINEEIRSLQAQLTRFKRERDTYKHMLEGAQKTIGDLKASSSPRKEHRSSTASFDEVEEYRTKVASLEQQISCMEDELSEARLEASKSKTELVSERSSWEIKMSEVHSRVNELEEERILSSGRTKIPGLRTRMELAWHKEREEQQRLLQETSTLARDLRQTLFEVERERDKERLESKRKQEQIKKTLEEDQEENRRKLSELQCDLLELRDAHAKLRTTNEKLRREKERHEKEREELRAVISERKRSELDDDRRINGLLEQVEMLMKLTSGGESSENEVYTPTPPRRTRGSKSREASPTLERKDFSKESSVSRDDRKNQIQSVMLRLNDVTDELRRYQRLAERNRDRDRIKRTMGLRRATSTEHDNVSDLNQSQKELSKNGNITTNLHRRSLSLEHTFPNEQDIWRNADDSLSSLQSIDASSDIESKWVKRDASLDSRLSSTSTQSETGAVEKKKKGLIGKLKKLTKSRSIDDKDPGHFSNPRSLSSKPNSGSDVNEDVKDSKKDLKDRLTGIFKRGGSSSRSNSLERQSADKHDNRSTQRPLMPNGSNPSISPPSPVVDTVKRYSSKPTKYK
ncbi:hypothetical protein PPYR_06277 [Photinus pyralis]|uniref:Uncharacterized protein n=1 Tax=Photinus pyralis TaxID=7054 RepID=A0A1Y1KN54_PHOPY|nr:trichohyalin-like isoform X3 [Photinus pyralis]KAB0800537.1 hypothetical protein PPYR_06277 [Photinus pyralis]